MSAKQYITASRQPSPAQIDELAEVLQLIIAAGKAIEKTLEAAATKPKSEATSVKNARQVKPEALAAMFPSEEIH